MIGKEGYGPKKMLMNLERDDLHMNPEYPHFSDIQPLTMKMQLVGELNEIIGENHFNVSSKILMGDIIVGGFLQVGLALLALLNTPEGKRMISHPVWYSKRPTTSLEK